MSEENYFHKVKYTEKYVSGVESMQTFLLLHTLLIFRALHNFADAAWKL